MKLYDVPRNSRIKVKSDIQEEQILIFNNIDGMYSHCLDSEGNVVHLAAYTEVEIINE